MSKTNNYKERLAKRAKTKEKHSKMFCRTIEVKICENKLSKQKRKQLKRLFYENKCYYNWLIEDIDNRVYEKGTEKTTKITKLNKKGEKVNVTIKLLSSNARQKMINTIKANIKTLSTLKKKGYQKPGKLKFKSEKNVIEYKHPVNDIVIRWDKMNRVKIPGLGDVRVRGLRQLLFSPGIEIANARLIRRATGYFIQFVTYWPIEHRLRKVKYADIIGVDLGCSNTVTFSDGTKISVNFEETQRLKRLQRELSRKKKHSTRRCKRSKSYARTRVKLRKEYQKLSNRKQNAANQIIGECRHYAHVVTQDDPVSDWHKNGHGRSVQHSCLGTLKRKFKEDPNFVTLLDQYLPTSRTCVNCGLVRDDLTLDDRVFECDCGVCEDRDVHAARNMVNFYLNQLGTKHTDVKRVKRVAPADCSVQSSLELVGCVNNQVAYPRWSLKDASLLHATLKVPCL